MLPPRSTGPRFITSTTTTDDTDSALWRDRRTLVTGAALAPNSDAASPGSIPIPTYL